MRLPYISMIPAEIWSTPMKRRRMAANLRIIIPWQENTRKIMP